MMPLKCLRRINKLILLVEYISGIKKNSIITQSVNTAKHTHMCARAHTKTLILENGRKTHQNIAFQ